MIGNNQTNLPFSSNNEKPLFEWDSIIQHIAQPAENEFPEIMKGEVSLGGKQYTISIGYNEKFLAQKHNITADKVATVVRKIIQNLKPEDIIKFASGPISQAILNPGEGATIQLNGGNSVPLSYLYEHQGTESLAKAIDRIASAFQSNQFSQNIQNGNASSTSHAAVNPNQNRPLPNPPNKQPVENPISPATVNPNQNRPLPQHPKTKQTVQNPAPNPAYAPSQPGLSPSASQNAGLALKNSLSSVVIVPLPKKAKINTESLRARNEYENTSKVLLKWLNQYNTLKDKNKMSSAHCSFLLNFMIKTSWNLRGIPNYQKMEEVRVDLYNFLNELKGLQVTRDLLAKTENSELRSLLSDFEFEMSRPVSPPPPSTPPPSAPSPASAPPPPTDVPAPPTSTSAPLPSQTAPTSLQESPTIHGVTTKKIQDNFTSNALATPSETMKKLTVGEKLFARLLEFSFFIEDQIISSDGEKKKTGIELQQHSKIINDFILKFQSKNKEKLQIKDYENVLVSLFNFVQSNIELEDSASIEIKMDFISFIDELLKDKQGVAALENTNVYESLKLYIKSETAAIDRYVGQLGFSGIGLKVLDSCPSRNASFKLSEFVKDVNQFILEAEKSEFESKKNQLGDTSATPSTNTNFTSAEIQKQKGLFLRYCQELYKTEKSFQQQFEPLFLLDWDMENSVKGTFFQVLKEKGVINNQELEILEKGWQDLANSSIAVSNQMKLLQIDDEEQKILDSGQLDLANSSLVKRAENKIDAIYTVFNSPEFSMHTTNLATISLKVPQMIGIIAKILQNPKGKELLHEFRDTKNKGKGIDASFITPVQRSPRYELLIRDLLQNSSFLPLEKQNELRSSLRKLQAKGEIINKMQGLSKYLTL